MSDVFQQPKKATLLRSFEVDVAHALNATKKTTETAPLQKNTEHKQKKVYVKTTSSKRLFYVLAGSIMLIITVAASFYLYTTSTKPYTAQAPLTQALITIEVTPEILKTIDLSIQEKILGKPDGIYEIVLTKNSTPFSLSELYELLPIKKAPQKAEGLETFFYGARTLDQEVEYFIVFQEDVARVPLLPALYDDTLLSLGLHLLNLSEEAKTLLLDERFIQTHIQNIPVRSMMVKTDTGEEGIVITRIHETGALLLTTTKTLNNGLLDTLSSNPLVLSL